MYSVNESKAQKESSNLNNRVVKLLTPAGTYVGNMSVYSGMRTLDILNTKQTIPETHESILENFLELNDVHTPRGNRELVRVQKKKIVCAMDYFQNLGVEQERLGKEGEELEFYLSTNWSVKGKVLNFIPSSKYRQFIAVSEADMYTDKMKFKTPFVAVNKDYIIDYHPL